MSLKISNMSQRKWLIFISTCNQHGFRQTEIIGLAVFRREKEDELGSLYIFEGDDDSVISKD